MKTSTPAAVARAFCSGCGEKFVIVVREALVNGRGMAVLMDREFAKHVCAGEKRLVLNE